MKFIYAQTSVGWLQTKFKTNPVITHLLGPNTTHCISLLLITTLCLCLAPKERMLPLSLASFCSTTSLRHCQRVTNWLLRCWCADRFSENSFDSLIEMCQLFTYQRSTVNKCSYVTAADLYWKLSLHFN